MLSRVNIRLDYETVRFLSALEALRHLGCQRYFRQRGAHIWRIMHHLVHNWLHLQLARAVLIPDVYRVYGADHRDRNVDCLECRRKRYSRLARLSGRFLARYWAYIQARCACERRHPPRVFCLRCLRLRVSHETLCHTYASSIWQHSWSITVTLYVKSRLGIKWKPYHYSFYSSAHLWMLTAIRSYVLAGWSRIPRAVGKLYRINSWQATWETLREGACLPAFPWIILPNCSTILINREGRQIVVDRAWRTVTKAINA